MEKWRQIQDTQYQYFSEWFLVDMLDFLGSQSSGTGRLTLFLFQIYAPASADPSCRGVHPIANKA